MRIRKKNGFRPKRYFFRGVDEVENVRPSLVELEIYGHQDFFKNWLPLPTVLCLTLKRPSLSHTTRDFEDEEELVRQEEKKKKVMRYRSLFLDLGP